MNYYTVDEIAEKIKIPAMTLRKYLRNGTLKGAKIGGHWRISDEQFQDFITRHTPTDEAKEVLK